MEKENDEARKAARKLEKERKRLEMGSDYEMSQEEDEDAESQINGQTSSKKRPIDEEDYDSEVRRDLYMQPLFI